VWILNPDHGTRGSNAVHTFEMFRHCLEFCILFAIISLPVNGVPEVYNANHIFNAIHSSMRQWGSSINHNGMSVFLATVPAGLPLYHGNSRPQVIQGMEWLAFEPEHAMVFAWPHLHPPVTGPPAADEAASDGSTIEQIDTRKSSRGVESASFLQFGPTSRSHYRPNEQVPLGIPDTYQNTSGYLHTYTTKHALRLLYVDGLSAGKTSNGTLDSQDILLLNQTYPGEHGRMFNDWERGVGLCNLSSTLWQNKIDGILRMEGGFEIILCDFDTHVERTDILAISREKEINDPEHGFGGLGDWSYFKAITSRYHSIGGDRVRLDYEEFVSVLAYPEVKGLWDNNVQSDYAMPRLQNVKRSDLLKMRSDVTRMILSKDWDKVGKERDWQTVADMVVARYGKPLRYLRNEKSVREDKEKMQEYLGNLLRPFIDYSNRSTTLETNRCVAQLVPLLPSHTASLAHRTVSTITQHICDTLLTALTVTSTPASALSQATELINNLVDYLQWTSWKQCPTCADEEVCYIPIWPMGTHEDHAQPRCRSEQSASGRWGYWENGFGRR
jgi:hypothetical protein